MDYTQDVGRNEEGLALRVIIARFTTLVGEILEWLAKGGDNVSDEPLDCTI